MPKRKSYFSEKLRKKYPCFAIDAKNLTRAHCNICDINVSVANGGGSDLEHHVQSKKHKLNMQAASTSRSMDNFVIQKFTPLELKICAAEATLAFHVVMHHQSFRSQDCNLALLCDIIDDSNIAKKISCARTKTEAIIRSIISLRIIDADLQRARFISKSTDGSNHGHHKMFPLMVQFFDLTKNGIQVKMLNLEEKPNETAKTIGTWIQKILEKHGIEDKVIAFVADNTNTNFDNLHRRGEENIHTFLKVNIGSEILGVGCSAHILHNSVQHGLGRFGLFDIDVLAFKMYQYFSISTVRTEELKNFCEFVDISFRELLKHSKTRWLSLLPVVQRIIQLYPALKPYFLSTPKPPVVLQSFFEHDFGECYIIFVHLLMSVFYDSVKKLEKESNSLVEIVKIIDCVTQAVRDRISETFLPLVAKKHLSKLRTNGKNKECDDFIRRVLEVYEETYDYLIKWTASLAEFRVFEWFDFQQKRPLTPGSIENSVEYLQSKGLTFDDTKLFDQAMNLVRFINEKQNQKDQCFIGKTCSEKILEFFNANIDFEAYSEILKVAQFFFAIPGQNANCERVFSLIKAQWTDERNRLEISTVRDLINIKFNMKQWSCRDFRKYLLRPENESLLREVSESSKYDR